MEDLLTATIWFSTVAAGLMAGIYFTFSTFVMRSLDALETPNGMLAMQSINRLILKSSFLPLFFVSSLLSAALAVIAATGWPVVGAFWILLGGATYAIGMFLVTLIGNVPLNNRLEASAADGENAAHIWADYLRRWTRWNHVRTIACTMSLVFFILAIAERA
ncbi:MAG: anthrone oxygenase family protein [Erythrobacter sp.]